MLRTVLSKSVDVITEAEAIRGLVIDPGEYVAFLGAGLSREAGVPLADEICTIIRDQLALSERQPDDKWAHNKLNWDDPERRYSTCLKEYGSAASRVDYFRRLLKGVSPSFAHHALALLMANDILHPTAVTTNFDKLIEKSFVEQNVRECQSIRMSDEAVFWGQEKDKCYLLKLHGDYDTHNILNTREETRSIDDDFFTSIASRLLLGRGLLALGSAGNEESINKFLERLLESNDKRMLSRGVRWGIYVGPRMPDNLSETESADILIKAIEMGRLNRHLLDLLSDFNETDRPCQLFPVWGSGGFFLRLIKRLGDRALEYNAQLLLDHDMRVASLLEIRGIPPKGIDKYLERLKRAESNLSKRQHAATDPPRKVIDFRLKTSGAGVEIVYCDIASQDLLGSRQDHRRRAVVSSDDTLISAGGGVALSLLSKAGKEYLLNELGKLAPIPQGTAVVTSAGNIPLHYIIHAAAMDIDDNGDYSVTRESITSAMCDALTKAGSLGVTSTFVPLIGAGAGGVKKANCLDAILEAADSSQHLSPDHHLTIVIFDEIILDRNAIQRVSRRWKSETKLKR
jgi:O-acetyl-ADP-ribose deacetylase (regulator of RNase III)